MKNEQADQEMFKTILYPANWPGEPVFKLGDFLKNLGTIEGIIRDGAHWFYYVRGQGWFKEDDLLLREEPEPTGAGKLDNAPTAPFIDTFDPFLDLE